MERERNIEFSSYWTPQESDVAHTKAARAVYAQQLEHVRQQIWRLQAAELALEQEIHHCNVVLAPIRRIPDDILREIFVRTLPRVVRMTRSSAPLLLMHVCRRWRQVAGAPVPLWTCLSVDSLDSACAATEILQHSAIERAPSILTSIAPMLTRLSLHRVPLRLLIHPQPDSFPSLERLVISPLSEPLGGDLSVQAFKDAPRLRYVSMYGWERLMLDGFLNARNVQVILPWRQLTHFLCETRAAVKYLPSCTNLTYFFCDLDDSWVDPPSGDFDGWVDLPSGHFEQLGGLGFRSTPVITFFKKYEVANLKSLRLQARNSILRWDPLQRAVSSRCSNLTHLSFSFVFPTNYPFDCRDFFGSIPTIQTLDLEMIDGWDWLFQAFKWCDNDRRQQLLPHLRTLIIRPWKQWIELITIQAIPIPTSPFLSFVSSRMARPLEERISKIVAYPSEPLDPLLIQQYIDNGLAYKEYPVGNTLESWYEDEGWMESNPVLHDWPELEKRL